MGFIVLLILLVLIGGVSAANNAASGQDVHNEISQEEISTGNDDSKLNEMENNEILDTSVGGDTFADIQTAISSAKSGDTIELDGIYNGSGTAIIIDKDNLTIIGNDAILNGQGQSRILNITSTGITLKNIKFINGNVTDNGGAVYWGGDNGTIDNCSFTNNIATQMGGAIYWFGANGAVNNSNFINNTATKKGGGAIYWMGSNGTVSNSSFTDNIGTQKGGAICWCGVNGTISNSNFKNDSSFGQGGAIFWDPTASNGAVNNSSFINNTGTEGGAVYWFGEYGIMNGCNFTSNTGSNGGALNWQKKHGCVNGCNFINNTAQSNGGAIYWEGSNGTESNCNFTDNLAANGGAVYWYANNGTISNTIFSNNRAESNGGAVYNGGKTIINCSNFIENNATVGRAVETAADMIISNCEFMCNGENCIDVGSGAKLTLNNVSSDAPLVNDSISMEILEAEDVVYGKDVNIKVLVNSSAIYPLNSGKVVVKVNNVVYDADVKDGIATLIIPKLNAGTYNADVAFIDYNMSKADIPVSFTVNKRNITINAENEAVVINYAKTYKVSFKNVNDGVKVAFTLNGKKIGTSTIKNGFASIKLTAKILKTAKTGKKNMIIKIENSNYSPISKTVKIAVNKEKTKITAKSKTFKRTAKIKKYTIILKNSKSKAMKKAKVYLKVNGKTYSAKTDSKGKATFKIKRLTKIGKHKASIKFKGNSLYRPVSKSVRITVRN
ncbi:right-handed parallel beta-helix repeat-containing protein [Methanobrevibacter sp.]|uniref:right-handed parallel beta-helix repeat-containing protein n=1 Tax=Methanobrevibacter sp. TaxID=66852 RepID=UPI0025D2F207|nr:right-handed parallel beta-helix repeat-containing protein [Methanobrevibacter sp.]MBQ2831439.1 hypothetical protein [Methanobrevibacter sp.]